MTMPYSTLGDMQKKIANEHIIELTDDDDTGSVDQAKVDAAIEEADEMIDSHVGRVKTVPLSPVPGIIKNLSVTMAIWYLHERRGISSEVREKGFNSALKTLQMIADGKVTLGDDEAVLPESTTEGGPQSSTTDEDRVFTKDTLTNL